MSKEKIFFTRLESDTVFDSIPLVDIKSVQPINEPPQNESKTTTAASNSKVQNIDLRKKKSGGKIEGHELCILQNCRDNL